MIMLDQYIIGYLFFKGLGDNCNYWIRNCEYICFENIWIFLLNEVDEYMFLLIVLGF